MEDLETQLKQREVLRFEGKDDNGWDFTVRYFDTGQLFIAGTEEDEKITLEGRKRIYEPVEVSSSIEYDFRTGKGEHCMSSKVYSHPIHHWDLQYLLIRVLYANKAHEFLYKQKIAIPQEPLGYPELTFFTDKVHAAFGKKQYHPKIPAIFAVPFIAIGVHDHFRPRDLLDVGLLSDILFETLFPWTTETGYDMEKGQRAYKNVTLPDDQKYIAVVRTGWYGKTINYTERLNVLIFNKQEAERFAKEKFSVTPLPHKDDTVFHLQLTWGDDKQISLSPYKFDERDLWSFIDSSVAESALEQQYNAVVLPIEESFVETVAKIAPLPLHKLRPRHKSL